MFIINIFIIYNKYNLIWNNMLPINKIILILLILYVFVIIVPKVKEKMIDLIDFPKSYEILNDLSKPLEITKLQKFEPEIDFSYGNNKQGLINTNAILRFDVNYAQTSFINIKNTKYSLKTITWRKSNLKYNNFTMPLEMNLLHYFPWERKYILIRIPLHYSLLDHDCKDCDVDLGLEHILLPKDNNSTQPLNVELTSMGEALEQLEYVFENIDELRMVLISIPIKIDKKLGKQLLDLLKDPMHIDKEGLFASFNWARLLD